MDKSDELGTKGGAVATEPEKKLIISKLNTLCSQAKGRGCGTDEQTNAIKDDATYKLLKATATAKNIKCKAGSRPVQITRIKKCAAEKGCTWDTCSFANTKMGASSGKGDAEIYYDYGVPRLYEKWIKCGTKGAAAEIGDATSVVTKAMGGAVMKSSYPYDAPISDDQLFTLSEDDLKHGAWLLKDGKAAVNKATGLPSEWEDSINNMKVFCGTNHHTQKPIKVVAN